MREIKRILLTGGGSAGHVNPALAIGSAAGTPGTRYLYVGVRGRVEEEVVPREGIPVKFVRASYYPGARHSFAFARFLIDLLIGTLQSTFILARFRPEVVVGTGGYASAPVIIASALLRKLRLSRAQVFIHEQNAEPGKLNRLMGSFAHRVFVTFPETLAYFRTNGVLAGYPLRARIRRVGREEARARLDFSVPEGRKVVFAFGGSQGSRTINRAVVDALRHLLPLRRGLFVIHGMGLFRTQDYHACQDTEARLHRLYTEEELRQLADFYCARPFFHEIEMLYAVSDLVVVRGGAGSLNEVSAVGLPAIIIPKSNLPGDHQVMNARAMQRVGGAEIIYEEITLLNGNIQEYVDGKMLAEKILSMLQERARLREMGRRSEAFLRRDAAVEIVRHIHACLDGATLSAGAPLPESRGSNLPDNRTFLVMLERLNEKLGSHYAPEAAVSCPDDIACLKNRAASLLAHADWQQRNVGVKLLGLLKAREKIPLLLSLFRDRRRASLVRRMFGGDFEQVGFIRRNIMIALMRIDEVSPEIEAALLLAFQDPYYEVRSEAARAAAHFSSRLSSRQEILSALLRLASDPKIEVAVSAVEAVGKIADGKVLPALLAMKGYKYWKARAAALNAIHSLVERGQVKDFAALLKDLPEFILTSTDFTPQFEIKSEYRRLIEAVSKGRSPRQ